MEDLEEDEPPTLVPIPGRKMALPAPPLEDDETSSRHSGIGGGPASVDAPFPEYSPLYPPYLPGGGNGVGGGVSKGGRSYTKKDMEDALEALRHRKLSLTRYADQSIPLV